MLIQGWVLINFFCLSDGRLFQLGANSRLGSYSNKYCILNRSHEMGLHKTGISFSAKQF